MKKLLCFAIVAMLAAFTVSPALAHGSRHGGGHKKTVAKVTSVCPIESCVLTGQHTHNKKTYSAHYYGDGHKYHAYCELEDCELAGYHSHDGTYCFGHTYNDGCGHISGGHH